MQMLSPWIEDASGHALRVFAGSDQTDPRNHAVQVLNDIPSVRIRAAGATHDDSLNWAQGNPSLDNKGWCDRMAKSFGYALCEEGLFVIQYADGAFNMGPEGSEMNGFPVSLDEASRYTTMQSAQAKLVDVLYTDGTSARIVRVCDLDINDIQAASNITRKAA